jgi:hypothetical protein
MQHNAVHFSMLLKLAPSYGPFLQPHNHLSQIIPAGNLVLAQTGDSCLFLLGHIGLNVLYDLVDVGCIGHGS